MIQPSEAMQSQIPKNQNSLRTHVTQTARGSLPSVPRHSAWKKGGGEGFILPFESDYHFMRYLLKYIPYVVYN